MKRAALLLLLLASSRIYAASVGTPLVSPSTVLTNVSTSIKVTVQVSDSTVFPGGVNLLRLGTNGWTVLGVMHDDGLNGDTTSGDRIFTYQFTTTEATLGSFQLQCSAAFRGVVQRTRSTAVTVNVIANVNGTVGAPAIAPGSAALGVATPVTVTAAVSPAPDASSVMLQRLDSNGLVTAVLGTMHDDGLNGDATSGDGIFSLQTTFTEFAVGAVSLRVSATFNAGISHQFSTASTLSVTGTPPPAITITSPANLSSLNLSPTTVSGTVSDATATLTINSLAVAVAGNGSFSAQIPLAEGPNIITATAAKAPGTPGTASVSVTLDTTPPHVTVTSPPDQYVTAAATISVAGNVNDTVVGTVNNTDATVKVNTIASQVANRTFLAASVPLTLGSNTIQVVATDRAGNAATTQITVVRQAPVAAQIQMVSGNNQSATIGVQLTAPLIVSLTDTTGAPAANQPVIFQVTQNNGMLTAGASTAPNVMATTNAQGQAQVSWTLGMRSGAGSDGVQAYAVGYGGTAMFTATATQSTPGMIVVDSGNNQTAAVNRPLPKPLVAVVVDAGHNRLSGVPVTFIVKQGGGSFAGQPSVVVNTDSDGRAVATLSLGFQEGMSNNLASADFPNNTGFPASFMASGLGPGDPAKTTISGIVLDNSNQAIPGVTIRAVLTNVMNSNSNSVQAASMAQTDANGQFTISSAPVGFVKLLVDGSTALATGTFPTLDYDMVTVAGQNNTVGQPIYLLAIKTNNQLCVTATTGGGTLTIPEAPGFSLTFGPGQVTFPGGPKTGCVSVTVVHPDKVPMVPGFGQQPRFIVTIQPSGALFNPPAPITLPNVDGLAPRAVTEMYSFDHDIGSFVAIGTGTISDDGQVIRSNPGIGVVKAGWHCGGNPDTPGAAATCPTCMFCQGTQCAPQGNGSSCGGTGTCQFAGAGQQPTCNCPTGQVLVNGQCQSPPYCPPGTTFNASTGQCCGSGQCQNPPNCPPGTTFDPTTGQCCGNGQCQNPPNCPPGTTFDVNSGLCCDNNGQCQQPCSGTSCPPCASNMFFNGSCVQTMCTPQTAGQYCLSGGTVPGTCNGAGHCTGIGNQCPDSCTGGCVDGSCSCPSMALSGMGAISIVGTVTDPGLGGQFRVNLSPQGCNFAGSTVQESILTTTSVPSCEDNPAFQLTGVVRYDSTTQTSYYLDNISERSTVCVIEQSQTIYWINPSTNTQVLLGYHTIKKTKVLGPVTVCVDSVCCTIASTTGQCLPTQ